MFACVFLLYVALSESMTVRRYSIQPAISAKYKEELPPLLISCNLNNVAIISTPKIRYNKALYYLHKPNGDVTQLNITTSTQESEEYDNYIDNRVIKNEDRLMFPKTSYRIVNLYSYKIDSETKDEFDGKRTKDEFEKKGNEFVIGPVMAEDHGNWVLSVYYSEDGTWIEIFQVITIEVIEHIPSDSFLQKLNPGDTFKLSFAYPIKQLESCELTVPKSSYDRYYELTSSYNCAYAIYNVTEEDGGLWVIRGVGRIVYEARTLLKVRNKVT